MIHHKSSWDDSRFCVVYIDIHCYMFDLISRREDNIDVEISASGFTKEMESSFNEVRLYDIYA